MEKDREPKIKINIKDMGNLTKIPNEFIFNKNTKRIYI